MFTGLSPAGSVVLLMDSTKKAMIIGFLQKEVNGLDSIREGIATRAGNRAKQRRDCRWDKCKSGER